MLRIQAMKIRQGIVLALGVVLVGLAVFALAQNKKETRPVTLRDVVVREGKNGARLKDTSKFEMVRKGTGEAIVQFRADKKIVGSLLCGVCPGGKCDTLLGPNGGVVCVGCGAGNKDCTLNPF